VKLKLGKNKIPKPDVLDILTIAGVISLAIGLWMIYHPAMFVTIGLGFIWIGLPQKGVK